MTSSTNPGISLKDEDLSAIYASSDLVSGRGQRRTKTSVRAELLGFIVASVAGITSYRVGAAHLDVLAAVSAVAFAASLVSSAFRAWMKPERDWYAGRAAAESVKTMGWRYAVGGDLFQCRTPIPKLHNVISRGSNKSCTNYPRQTCRRHPWTTAKSPGP